MLIDVARRSYPALSFTAEAPSRREEENLFLSYRLITESLHVGTVRLCRSRISNWPSFYASFRA